MDVDLPFTVAVADRYSASPRSRGIWRRRARFAIVRAIAEIRDDLQLTCKEALALVDAAYPFGERAMAPYKAWLAERRLFIAAFDEPATDLPTVDDAAACEVAVDLVELKQFDDAKKLLAEQAPRRFAVKCPTCGANPGKPCVDLSDDAATPIATEVIGTRALDCGSQGPRTADLIRRSRGKRTELIVPHMARVRPPSGPLFANERTSP